MKSNIWTYISIFIIIILVGIVMWYGFRWMMDTSKLATAPSTTAAAPVTSHPMNDIPPGFQKNAAEHKFFDKIWNFLYELKNKITGKSETFYYK